MAARILVALTGASGTIYGVRAVQRLAAAGFGVDVIVSDAARKVLAIEHGLEADPQSWLPEGGDVDCHHVADITAAPASGSRVPAAMLVIPCSMGSAARIATGVSGNLIERAADVVLKERRPLVIVPRETPFSSLHLRNLLTLSELGARVVPAMPGFYARPETVEDLIAFVVDRALAAADLDLPLRSVWRSPDGACAP